MGDKSHYSRGAQVQPLFRVLEFIPFGDLCLAGAVHAGDLNGPLKHHKSCVIDFLITYFESKAKVLRFSVCCDGVKPRATEPVKLIWILKSSKCLILLLSKYSVGF